MLILFLGLDLGNLHVWLGLSVGRSETQVKITYSLSIKSEMTENLMERVTRLKSHRHVSSVGQFRSEIRIDYSCISLLP